MRWRRRFRRRWFWYWLANRRDIQDIQEFPWFWPGRGPCWYFYYKFFLNKKKEENKQK